MSEIQRYRRYFADHTKDSGGDYVLYTDHIAALEAVKATKPPERCACNFGTHCIYRNNGNECPRVKRLAAFVTPLALEADRLADKIEDMIEEFGDDPKAALDCISEWISLRHSPIPALEAEKATDLADLCHAIEDAYIRGATWYRTNQDFGGMLRKAAQDYADKQTFHLPSPALEANQQVIPEGYEITPIKCGGCSATMFEHCRRSGGANCFREHFGGSRSAISATKLCGSPNLTNSEVAK